MCTIPALPCFSLEFILLAHLEYPSSSSGFLSFTQSWSSGVRMSKLICSAVWGYASHKYLEGTPGIYRFTFDRWSVAGRDGWCVDGHRDRETGDVNPKSVLQCCFHESRFRRDM